MGCLAARTCKLRYKEKLAVAAQTLNKNPTIAMAMLYPNLFYREQEVAMFLTAVVTITTPLPLIAHMILHKIGLDQFCFIFFTDRFNSFNFFLHIFSQSRGKATISKDRPDTALEYVSVRFLALVDTIRNSSYNMIVIRRWFRFIAFKPTRKNYQ